MQAATSRDPLFPQIRLAFVCDNFLPGDNASDKLTPVW
jgi:hypothetical protein